MVAGRNASSMASELGSMVVTEQIDAMRALGVDPMRKLVTPRIFASIVMLLLSDHRGRCIRHPWRRSGDGLLNHQNGTQYFHIAYEHLRYPDIIQGLVKPLFFGYILSSIGCFYGMRTTGGTEGVGRSTISAVVTSSVLIISVDFLITHVLALHLSHMSHASAPAPQSPAPAPDASPVVACAMFRSPSTDRQCLRTSAFPWLLPRRAFCSGPRAWAKASCSN